MKRTPLKRKPRKPRGWRDCPKWLAAIRSQACIHCGTQGQTQAAHVRTKMSGAMGQKPSDDWCVPLCAPCHHEQHQGNEPSTRTLYAYLTRLWSFVGVDRMHDRKQRAEAVEERGPDAIAGVSLYREIGGGLR